MQVSWWDWQTLYSSKCQISSSHIFGGAVLLQSEDTSSSMEDTQANEKKKKKSHRDLDKFTSRIPSLLWVLPGAHLQQFGVGAAPLDVHHGVFLHCHNQVSQLRAGTRGEDLCSRAREWHFEISFHHPRTSGWSVGFPGWERSLGIMQMVVESHRSSVGATVEENDRTWCVDKVNIKIPFPGCFYVKVSLTLGVFPELPYVLKVAGMIPSSCSSSQRCSWLWTSKQFLKESLEYKKCAKQAVF